MPIVELLKEEARPAIPRPPSKYIVYGHHAPNPTTNEQLLDLEAFKDSRFFVKGELVRVTPEHIVDRTGIHRRSIADRDETVIDMMETSAKKALAQLKIPEINVLLAVTSHPTGQDITAEIAKRFGLTPRHRMTYHAACSGSALALADMATNGILKPDDWVMLSAGEKYLDTMDPNANTLDFAVFGEESVTMIFQAHAIRFLGQPLIRRFYKSQYGGDPTNPLFKYPGDFLSMRVDPEQMRAPYTSIKVPKSPYFRMNGKAVVIVMSSEIPRLIQDSWVRSELNPAGIDLVYHPGTERVANGIAKRFKDHNSYSDIAEANTSGASVLRLAMRGAETGHLGVGSRVATAGFGGGEVGVVQNWEIAA